MKNISLLIILLLLFDSLTNATMAQSCNKFCCGKQAIFFIKNMIKECALTWESSGNVNSPGSPKMGLMYGQKSPAFYP